MLACRTDDGSYTLYGATSFGIGSGCLKPGYGKVFVRVSNYVDWVKTESAKMSSLVDTPDTDITSDAEEEHEETTAVSAITIEPVGCGIQAPGYDPTLKFNKKLTRIIGGDYAKPHSWPWQTFLLSEDRINETHAYTSQCGSSLVRVTDDVEASDILVTAAHCVTSDDPDGYEYIT